MKKAILFALLLQFSVAFTQREMLLGELRGEAANNIWQGTELIWVKQTNTIPAFIKFRAGSEPAEAEFFSTIGQKFNLPSGYTFQLLNTETDAIGWQHKRYQLLVNNVPVQNGICNVHLLNGKVKKYNGYIFMGITPANATPAITETAGLTAALKSLNAESYKWQIPAEEAFIKHESGNAKATFYPVGKQVLFQVGDNASANFRQAWQYDIYVQEPVGRYYVYVDAQTGEVLSKISRICDANSNATAVTGYRSTQNITTNTDSAIYRLRETTRGQGINTYNMLAGSNYGAAVDFTDTDNYWNNTNATKDQYAADAHWGAEMTFDFYQSMGRNSIDNAGYPLNLYVHYRTNYVNAFWDGTRMTFGDGNFMYTPFTCLDITGHEITHGLTERSAALVYQGEAGALNESFSDIFGTCIEKYADPAHSNWTIGEDIGRVLRSMGNPNLNNLPDTYHGSFWYNGTADFGGVHTNSGVQNYWFYLLSNGGAGVNDIGNAFNITGIGIDKAKQIAWRNLVYYLTNSATYADARFYAIESAEDIYGTCSPEAIATTKAWYAVGVGNDVVFTTHAQFASVAVNACTTPVTVQFTNLSTGAGNYQWQFGDGAISTATNPQHTYTAYGTHTVTLIASGGACDVDTMVALGIISIIKPNAPTVSTTSVCGTAQITINAATTNPVIWYSSTGNVLSQTNPFITTISNTETFYAEELIAPCASDRAEVVAQLKPIPTASLNTVLPTCNGTNNGAANVDVSSGTPPYSYRWNLGQTSSNINGLRAGNYSVTVVDAEGCSAEAAETLTQPDAINIAVNISADTCGKNTGAIVPNASGGTATYNYFWGNGRKAPYANNLTAGTYTITVTDINNCSGTASINVPAIAGLTVQAMPVDVTCNGEKTGVANVDITSGTPPYLYNWSNGSTDASLIDLPAGNYDVTVTDANNCTAADNVVITQPTPIITTSAFGNITCFADNNGWATVTPTGGTGVYTYKWSNNETNWAVNNLEEDYYTVTVYDEHNCTATTQVHIQQPDELLFTATVVNPSAPTADGSVIVSPTGGTPPYEIIWANSTSGTNLRSGDYNFTVTDVNGCLANGSVYVAGATGVQEVQQSVTFNAYPNPVSTTLFVSINNSTDSYQLKVLNTLGQTMLDAGEVQGTSFTKINVLDIATGTYWVEIKSDLKTLYKEFVISR